MNDSIAILWRVKFEYGLHPESYLIVAKSHQAAINKGMELVEKDHPGKYIEFKAIETIASTVYMADM